MTFSDLKMGWVQVLVVVNIPEKFGASSQLYIKGSHLNF